MDRGPNSGSPTFNWAIAKWNWTEVCGEKGFYIWDANQKDLGLCFSIIGIQLPLLTIFSVVSAKVTAPFKTHSCTLSASIKLQSAIAKRM